MSAQGVRSIVPALRGLRLKARMKAMEKQGGIVAAGDAPPVGLHRPGALAVALGIVLFAGGFVLAFYLSGGVWANNTVQTSAPAAQAAPAVTASPVDTVASLLTAIELGDTDIVATLTGGSGITPGIINWCSYDFNLFTGHTTFGNRRYVITHNDGQNANVHIDGFMTFTDPSGFPSVHTVTHWYIDGDFKLKANGNTWVVTSLPWYQAVTCDTYTRWSADPQRFPWPGDVINLRSH